jgi:hypothetical protein
MFAKLSAKTVNNRMKETGLISAMSLNGDLQTQILPNITNSIESLVSL